VVVRREAGNRRGATGMGGRGLQGGTRMRGTRQGKQAVLLLKGKKQILGRMYIRGERATW
jgi:hypothetical protein